MGCEAGFVVAGRLRLGPSPARRSRCGASRGIVMSAASPRKFFVGGNWKCNGSTASIAELVEAFNAGPAIDDKPVEVACAPPSPYLASTRQALRKDWDVSAQNSYLTGPGAYTGEITPEMIADVGAKFVILGHSERRNLPELKETDKQIADKAKFALDNGLGVIFCIGELLEEREAGNTLAVCERQIKALADVISDWSSVVVAYEPVWAIGTGKVATPAQAQEVHLALRTWMAANVSQEVADATRILYGGSVSPDNCDELAANPDVDGFLVGGASLKPDFLKIVDSYKIKLASSV